jgi:hypothetical protein
VKTLGREKVASYRLRPGFDYSQIGFAEARNFIDGKRSALYIYDAVSAEIWWGGYPPNQAIAPDELERYLQMLSASGLITLQPSPPTAR